MNVLFLTLLDFKTYAEHNLYCDLLREFIKNGHAVYCISPTEKRFNIETHTEESGRLLKLKIGNTQKTNLIEKGISTLMIEPQFRAAIKKYYSNIRFDLILYSTPPITLLSAIKYVKRRDSAKTYLMLKDIFPQNAVDLGMLQTTGIKSLLYRYFRNKEKKLYTVSDRIGCMSQANVDYVLKNNPGVEASKVEICPNAIEPQDLSLSAEEKIAMREKYGIPTDKKVFVYGGNLGKPQGIPFVIKCLHAEKDNDKVFFLIVGDGTEYGKLEAFMNEEKPANVKLMKRLPKDDYDRMISACDVGMIFLDYRFTIPNFPSRFLAYLQTSMVVFSCTDAVTDLNTVIKKANIGFCCLSNEVANFSNAINEYCALNNDEIDILGKNAKKLLGDEYMVSNVYDHVFKDKYEENINI